MLLLLIEEEVGLCDKEFTLSFLEVGLMLVSKVFGDVYYLEEYAISEVLRALHRIPGDQVHHRVLESQIRVLL